MAQPNKPQPAATPEQLAEHLDRLARANHADRDALLSDLLCHTYATLAAQNG